MNDLLIQIEVEDRDFICFYNTIPNEIKKIEGIDNLDIFQHAKKYFNEDRITDMSIDSNANVSMQKSFVNFCSEIEKPYIKLRNYYLLYKYTKERYGKEIAEKSLRSIFEGKLYFHDITKLDIFYCYAGSTTNLMHGGRPYGHLTSKPATRADSFIAQCIEFLMDMSQEHAGAIALADIFVNYAYYSKKERSELNRLAIDYNVYSNCWSEKQKRIFIDTIAVTKGYNLNKERHRKEIDGLLDKHFSNEITIIDIVNVLHDHEIVNHFQQFVHVANNQFRVGGDSPFSNVSLFDRHILQDTFKEHVYPDGTMAKDNIEEIMKCQYLFAEWFSQGNPETLLPYRFPICTINVSIDDNNKVKDKQFVIDMARYNARLGSFNWHSGEKIASCCRMVNDPARMAQLIRTDTFGNGGTSIGSSRVVAINLHRVAIEATVKQKSFAELLESTIEDSIRLLVVHRKDILRRRIKQGFYKFFNIGWESDKMFFATIGFTGLADALDVLGMPITTDDGYKLAINILQHLEDSALKYSEIEEIPLNVEEIPGESACGKLLQKDKYYYPELTQKRENLSNQIFPLSLNMPLHKRISKAGKLMEKVSGGSIMHINIKEGYMNPESSAKLIIKIIEKAKVPHFALNFGFSICENGHTTKKLVDICPVCGKEIVEQITRVVGYFSPVSSWSKPRQREFAKRRWLDILQEEEIHESNK